MRYALTLVCLLACLGFVSAGEVTLDGKVCCAKCELGKETKCQTVVVVKEKDKEVMYYFDKDSDKKFHKEYCSGSSEAKVVGKVTEKDGKKWLAVEKIEAKK
ncbi:MAG: DUF6370 family protein [Gemmatales bacterium]